MEVNNKLTLYVTYYLARFDRIALKNLGYSTWEAAFLDISNRLNVNKHSVRNWRDEFDPLFGHRAGWHQRPMNPSRINVALALENLDELEIRLIVKDILSGGIKEDADNLCNLLSLTDEEYDGERSDSLILRGPTGRNAEQYFVDYHRVNNAPVAGELIDSRDLGCGFDFEIKSESNQHFIEVKGLANDLGGLLFTNKEWEIAKKEGVKYTVCVVSNINKNPNIKFINDPASKLNPTMKIIQTVQTQWVINHNEMKKIND